ncbi:MAG TPA: pyruvate kinase [Rhabdochlamydiaceae bacterium]|nr:pyruvate kinase [Rhabdochlamydiaceae bacterium]
MRTRTKIICTMGPAVAGLDKMIQLIDAGMNVARLNFSHGTQAEHEKTIENLKKAREKRKVPLAIMMDTKGPEIRVGKLKNDSVSLRAKQKIHLVEEDVVGDEKHIPIHPEMALKALKPGHVVLFDDGYITTIVLEKNSKGITVEVQNDGILKSKKGVNIPGVDVGLPAMTKQDISDILFGCQQDIDIIAASFIRSAEHVREIKNLLIKQKCPNILVLAKIENSLGVQNFDAILQVADGIMVARGDLGVELPLKNVPMLQKMMIRKCIEAAKPVVTATQMLESMIKNPRPTRAEASDVANAIYDSTSAVMLSGETAIGAYPIETVALMKSIVEVAEEDFNYLDFFNQHSRLESHDVSSSISLAAVKTAYASGAKAIFASTSSGYTARMISRFRPKMPIIALSSDYKTYNQLAFDWGVISATPADINSIDEALTVLSNFARSKKLVEYGDLIVLTAGTPLGTCGATNMMLVESIGDVLVRGHQGKGEKVQGKITLLLSPEEKPPEKVKDRILVITRFDDSYEGHLKKARAVILQNHPEDVDSETKAVLMAKKLHLPILIRADGALSRLKEGVTVILDPEKGIVYKGFHSNHEEEMIPAITDPRD